MVGLRFRCALLDQPDLWDQEIQPLQSIDMVFKYRFSKLSGSNFTN